MLNYTYLSTPTDLTSFEPNDLKRFRYIILFDLGSRADEVDEIEFALICGSLAHFMHAEYLVTTTADLSSAPEGSYVKKIYHIFTPIKPMDAFVAIATVFPDINDEYLLEPAYQRLEWDRESSSRYPVYEALNHNLKTLRSRVNYSALGQFILPIPLTKPNPLACPFGSMITELRKAKGSQNEVSKECAPGKDRPLGRSTLRQAEEYEPISPDKLQEFADFFEVNISYISLKAVAPNSIFLSGLREESGLSPEKLAHTMGIASGYFFELLESADKVPAETMRFVYKQYKNILGKQDNELKFSQLLDLAATEALASNAE